MTLAILQLIWPEGGLRSPSHILLQIIIESKKNRKNQVVLKNKKTYYDKIIKVKETQINEITILTTTLNISSDGPPTPPRIK